MNSIEQDWHQLLDDWQQNEALPTATNKQNVATDKHLKTLAKKVIKDSKLERIGMIFTLAITLLISMYIISELSAGLPSKFDYVLYYAMLVMVVTSGVFTLWYQRGSWRVNAQHSVQYLTLMLKQSQAALKLGKVSEIFGYAILLTFYGIVMWIFIPSLFAGTLIQDLSSVAKPVLGSIILVLVTLIGLLSVFFSKRLQRSQTSKIDLLQKMIKDFE